METRPEPSDLNARSLQAVSACAPDPALAPRSESHPPKLQLVAGSVLTLADPSPDGAPKEWQEAMTQLANWLDLDVRQLPQRTPSGLRQMTAWAASLASRPAAPVFAPWQCWSPVTSQSSDKTPLPRASWVGSYLYDHGTGKPLQRGAIDLLLMSPLHGCYTADDTMDAPVVPRPDVLQAMIAAARTEGRQKLAIVTCSRQRNAMIRQLLLIDHSLTREGMAIDVLSIENALCELVRHPAGWDAIVVMPELRSLIFAMLAELSGVKSPWPMLWYLGNDANVCLVSGEALEQADASLPFNAPLLVQTMALAARHAGLSLIARQLAQAATRLWDCGIITPDRGSVAPYVTQVSDQEFIEQLCRGVAGGQRTTVRWRALAPNSVADSLPATPRRPALLRVVETP